MCYQNSSPVKTQTHPALLETFLIIHVMVNDRSIFSLFFELTHYYPLSRCLIPFAGLFLLCGPHKSKSSGFQGCIWWDRIPSSFKGREMRHNKKSAEGTADLQRKRVYLLNQHIAETEALRRVSVQSICCGKLSETVCIVPGRGETDGFPAADELKASKSGTTRRGKDLRRHSLASRALALCHGRS